MQSGMIFGIYWCISFLFLVSHDENLSAISSILILSTPFVGFILAGKFKKDVQKDGQVSFGRGYFFSLLMYFYATAILSLTSLFYFKYFDHGTFIQQNLDMLNRPEVKQALESADIQKRLSGINMEEIKTSISALTPTSITASILNFNVLFAFILSLPTAFFAMTRRMKEQHTT